MSSSDALERFTEEEVLRLQDYLAKGIPVLPREGALLAEWALIGLRAAPPTTQIADDVGITKRARQQLQWIAMQEDKAREFEARGEQRIPCFLQIEYVYESAKVYRELSSGNEESR